MARYLSVLVLPIVVLNWLAGIVGGIWLLIVGKWALLGMGLAVIFFGHFLLSLLLMPAMLLVVPAGIAFNANRTILGIVLSIPSILWTYALIGVSNYLIFVYVLGHMGSTSLLPILLWAYAASTANWTYMAAMEARGDPDTASGVPAFGAQVGCATMMIIVYLQDGHPDPIDLIIGLSVPLLIALLFQLTLATLAGFESRKFGAS